MKRINKDLSLAELSANEKKSILGGGSGTNQGGGRDQKDQGGGRDQKDQGGGRDQKTFTKI